MIKLGPSILHPVSLLPIMSYNCCAGVGQAIAASNRSRKVRTPQGSVPRNAREGRPYGKCHRKYTASPSERLAWRGKGEKVR